MRHLVAKMGNTQPNCSAAEKREDTWFNTKASTQYIQSTYCNNLKYIIIQIQDIIKV